MLLVVCCWRCEICISCIRSASRAESARGLAAQEPRRRRPVLVASIGITVGLLVEMLVGTCSWQLYYERRGRRRLVADRRVHAALAVARHAFEGRLFHEAAVRVGAAQVGPRFRLIWLACPSLRASWTLLVRSIHIALQELECR